MEDLAELARSMRIGGAQLEDVLSHLRAQGASIVDSLKIVRDVEGVALGEAKTIIDESRAWADAKTSNSELRESILTVLADTDLDV